MNRRARINRVILACAVAATSAIGFGSLAGWVPLMVRSLRAGSVEGVVGGGDFAMFWTAGRLAAQGNWTALYSLDGLAGVMGAPIGAVSFAYPPPFALLLQAFAPFDFAAAFSVWLAVGVASLALVLVLERGWGVFGLLAMLFSAYVALRFGQMVPIMVGSAAVAGRALVQERPFLAGVALGFLSLKPQFLLGPIIVLLANPSLRRSVLFGAAASAGSIAGLSLLIAPEAWSAYVAGLGDIANPGVSTRWDFSIASLASSLPPSVAVSIIGGAVAAAAWLAVRASRRTGDARAKLAIGLVLSLLLAPRVVNYDWTLLIPAIAWLAPSIRIESPVTAAGGFVTFSSLSGFVDASWLAWTNLGAFLAVLAFTHDPRLEDSRRTPR